MWEQVNIGTAFKLHTHSRTAQIAPSLVRVLTRSSNEINDRKTFFVLSRVSHTESQFGPVGETLLCFILN